MDAAVQRVIGYTRNLIHRGAEMLSRVQEMDRRSKFPLVRRLHCAALAMVYGQSARELIEMLMCLGLMPRPIADDFLSDAYALIMAAEAEFDKWEQWEHLHPVFGGT